MTTSLDAPASDDQLAARLARLQQRRDAASAERAAPGGDGDRPSPNRRSRRHPAAGARAAALVLTLATTGGLGALFANLNAAHADAQAIAALPAPLPTGPTATTATAAKTATSATATATGTQAFTGRLVDTKYGPVQVQVQLSGGTIADVAVVVYPDGDRKSRSINAQALPQLRTEVLAAQQASVDTVSGATYTSTAYEQSLQSAIDAARGAGVTTVV
jgi:uncharacterized protein with FMN-binding domain